MNVYNEKKMSSYNVKLLTETTVAAPSEPIHFV